jgi:hypothetical protein
MTAAGNPFGSIARAIVWFVALVAIAVIAGTVDTAWRKVAWLPPLASTDLRPAEPGR